MPHPNLIDLTGKKFNRLTVIRRIKIKTKRREAYWECLCDCGTKTIVTGYDLRNGNTKSCGCFRATAKFNFIHGMSHTPEFKSWTHMKDRCNNPNNKAYKNYGGRGIKIYPKWIKSFQAFFDYIGPKPTSKHMVERINNNKGYFPGNVKWALALEQANNKRNNHLITIDRRTLSISQWARIVNMNPKTIYDRINCSGWPPEKAIFEPVKHR